MPEPQPGRHLSDLEHKLRQLAPAGRVERDEIMYRAGQASVPVDAAASVFYWMWPAATVVMTLVALGLGMLLVLRDSMPGPPVGATQSPPDFQPPAEVHEDPHGSLEPEPQVPLTQSPAEAYPHHEAAEYRQLKAQALRWGADSLPSQPPHSGATGRPQSVRDLSKSLAKELGEEP